MLAGVRNRNRPQSRGQVLVWQLVGGGEVGVVLVGGGKEGGRKEEIEL